MQNQKYVISELDVHEGDRVLVLVAHSDDETLGAGGTIRRFVSEGKTVGVVSFTDGVSARGPGMESEVLSRQDAANTAAKLLGFSWLSSFGFPDNSLDTVPLLDMVKPLEAIASEFRPDLVFTHSSADLNVDHRKVLEATLVCFRPQPSETYAAIYSMEIPSATGWGHPGITDVFVPNVFVNISETLKSKEAAMEAYASEMRNFPHARSIGGIKHLAGFRGSQVGLEAAEAFQLVRKIVR